MSFFLTSCNQKPEIDVSVTNNSGTSIDSIWVSIAGKLQRFTEPVPVHRKGKLVIDFSKVGKNDGLIMFGFFCIMEGKEIMMNTIQMAGCQEVTTISKFFLIL